jgi:hypothetical protein
MCNQTSKSKICTGDPMNTEPIQSARLLFDAVLSQVHEQNKHLNPETIETLLTHELAAHRQEKLEETTC